jgi:hypothetical protein
LENTDVAITIIEDERQYRVLDSARSNCIITITITISFFFLCSSLRCHEINTLCILEPDPAFNPSDNESLHLRYGFHPLSVLDYYTTFPVHCPVKPLPSYIDKLCSSEWLLRKGHGRNDLASGGNAYERAERVLVGEYGWGSDGFREEELERECQRIWDEGLGSWNGA